MNTVKVNGKYEYQIEIQSDEILVNQRKIEIDYREMSSGKSSIIFQNKVYNVELLSTDSVQKTAEVKVNGQVYHLEIANQYDLLLKQMGMENLGVKKIQQVQAPMPGLVLEVMVQNGTSVQKGDNLLVLEAMKMENIIKSPCDGIIQQVRVQKGDKVEKNAVLIKFV